MWRRVRLAPADFTALRYGTANSDYLALSRGTRRVVDAAPNLARIETPSNVNVRAVASQLLELTLRYVSMEATTTRAWMVMRSIPMSETRTQASMTMPLSSTRSRTSMRLLLPGARSMGTAFLPPADRTWS